MFNTEQANCLGVEPDLFFPDGAIAPTTEKQLRRICMNCNIMDECLDYALRVKVVGYWAGTTDAQRVELRKLLDIQPVRIDQEYKNTFETNQAKNSRTYRERQKEAG